MFDPFPPRGKVRMGVGGWLPSQGHRATRSTATFAGITRCMVQKTSNRAWRHPTSFSEDLVP